MSGEHGLGRGARAILQALCDRLFDPDRDARTTASQVGVADLTSRSLTMLPPGTRRGLTLLLHVLNFLPLLVIGKFGRFVRLSAEDQDRFLHKVTHHGFRPLRMSVMAVKLLAAMHYWHDPRVLGELGYHGLDLIDEDTAMPRAARETA